MLPRRIAPSTKQGIHQHRQRKLREADFVAIDALLQLVGAGVRVGGALGYADLLSFDRLALRLFNRALVVRAGEVDVGAAAEHTGGEGECRQAGWAGHWRQGRSSCRGDALEPAF